MVMVMTRIMSMEQQVGTRKNSLVNKRVPPKLDKKSNLGGTFSMC